MFSSKYPFFYCLCIDAFYLDRTGRAALPSSTLRQVRFSGFYFILFIHYLFIIYVFVYLLICYFWSPFCNLFIELFIYHLFAFL